MLLEAISLSLRSARREYRRPLPEPCGGFPGCLLGPGGIARMSSWSPALDNGQDPTDQDSRTSFSDKRPPESSPQEVSTRWAPRSLERRSDGGPIRARQASKNGWQDNSDLRRSAAPPETSPRNSLELHDTPEK